LTDRKATSSHDLAHLIFTTTQRGIEVMSTIETAVTLRVAFERTAALLLYVATTAVVASGTIAMCANPVLF
jgi:hypothetical protein